MRQTGPHSPLNSKENSTIQRFRSLLQVKHRKKERLFLLEGVKMVEEALRDDLGVRTVIASPSLLRHYGKGILKLAEIKKAEIVWISERLMDSLSESKTPQPVMAEVRMRQHTVEELFSHPSKLIVLTHELQDPGNLGTIIRTCEAAGVSGLAVTQKTVDPFNGKTIRASMGSILRLPVVHLTDTGEFLVRCRELGFQTVAADLTARQTHFEADLRKPTVIVFGREGSGLPQEVLTELDIQVRIPMAESIDSLNVATSAAIILYEAVRQRMRHDEKGRL